MSKFDYQNISEEVSTRILGFLNQVEETKEISDLGRAQRGPGTDPEKRINGQPIENLEAIMILGKRNSLSDGKFTAVQQLGGVAGFTQGNLDYLVDFFSKYKAPVKKRAAPAPIPVVAAAAGAAASTKGVGAVGGSKDDEEEEEKDNWWQYLLALLLLLLFFLFGTWMEDKYDLWDSSWLSFNSSAPSDTIGETGDTGEGMGAGITSKSIGTRDIGIASGTEGADGRGSLSSLDSLGDFAEGSNLRIGREGTARGLDGNPGPIIIDLGSKSVRVRDRSRKIPFQENVKLSDYLASNDPSMREALAGRDIQLIYGVDVNVSRSKDTVQKLVYKYEQVTDYLTASKVAIGYPDGTEKLFIASENTQTSRGTAPSNQRIDASQNNDIHNDTHNDTHVVKQGETLFSIAKAYGLTVSDLKYMNGLKDDNIEILQKLRVR